MIQTVIGISDDFDLADCRNQLGARSPQAGILFASCMDACFSDSFAPIPRD